MTFITALTRNFFNALAIFVHSLKAKFTPAPPLPHPPQEPDDFAQEILLTTQNQELMDLLANRRQQPATISLEELETELGL